ncbi:hypothetical protein [Nonomuraea salmonea]|uniref:hypothetical protein n=1 Tax=Nonomuraea salmonea TaxID=46181 RepID=UPI002FEA8C0A
MWEPPYHVDDSAPPLPGDFAGQLGALVAAGRRGEVVERFMVEAAEVPVSMLDAMRGHPSWAAMEAVAHTLVYEAAVLGPGNALPAARLAGLTQPTLVLNGGREPGLDGERGRGGGCDGAGGRCGAYCRARRTT